LRRFIRSAINSARADRLGFCLPNFWGVRPIGGEGLTERQRGLTMKKIVTSAIIALAAMTAADAADMPLKAVKARPMPSWWDTLTITGLVEVGGSVNGNNPAVTNFGQLFTDKSNSAFLNQASLTVQRPLDPKATGYDFGFKFQAMYGSDARYTHFLGEFDQSIGERNQFDIVEAHALFHLPWLTSGGGPEGRTIRDPGRRRSHQCA
jgi:Putative beta-barrel porin-2, OmpL-like. bbp2